MNAKILCGKLTMYESEGGFAPIDVEIEGENLGVAIAELFDVFVDSDRGGNLKREGLIGNVAITIIAVDSAE